MEPREFIEVLSATWKALSAATWLQSFVTGAVGAAIGSLATQSVISRYQLITSARAELNATKQAINLCFVMLNHYLSFKSQMVVPMVARFEELDKNTRAALTSPIKGTVAFETDFRLFPFVAAPVAHLDALMLEKVSMGGRGLAAALQIRSVDASLRDSIEVRNQMIGKFESSSLDGRKLADVYLGLETDRGADSRFKDNITAISLYTDDAIFFSHTTLQELRKHAARIIRRNGRKVGSKRDLGSFDFKEEAAHLLPPDEKYHAWLSGFKERRPWWKFWGSN